MNKRVYTMSFRKAIFFLNSAIVFLSLVIVTFLWTSSEIKQYHATVTSMKNHALEKQKAELKLQVQKILDYIGFKQEHFTNLTEEEIKHDVLLFTAEQRFAYGGYAFINQMDGKALVFDGKIVETNKSIKNITDPNGLSLYEHEVKHAKNPLGGFMEYHFKKMNSDIPEPKISFIMGYAKWDWIVGAGNYKNDISAELAKEKNKLVKRLRIKIISILILFLCVTMLIFVIAQISSKLFQRQFALIDKLFHKSLNLKNSSTTEVSTRFLLHEISSFIEKIELIIQKQSDTEVAKNEIEEKFSKAFYDQNTPIAIIDINNGKSMDANKSFIDFFALTDASQKDTRIFTDSYWVQPEKQKQILQNLIKNRYVQNFESEIIVQDHLVKSVLINAAMLSLGKGNLAIFSILDITPQKNAEKALTKHQQELEEIINKRTGELKEKNRMLEKNIEELEKFNNLFVEREFRIKELKDQIKDLENQLNKSK